MTPGEYCREYNRIYNKYSELYHDLAVRYGFSDMQYWLLYTLYTSSEPVTQNDLAVLLGTPKQTINSAAARLAKNGIVTLSKCRGRGNSKAVCLTGTGKALCESSVKPLVDAEERASSKIPEDEMKMFLTVYEKRYKLFYYEVRSILEEKIHL